VANITVRMFRQADTEAIIGLWRRCGLVVDWNDPNRDILRKAAVQPELFLVGLVSGRLVASAMGGYDGHRGSVYYLAVDPDFHNRGYGRSLLNEVENRLLAMGCPKINIMVRRSNTQVRDFYTAVGYGDNKVLSLGKRLIPDC
jgi:ribosomal protein S18 acetylase RimI-like enzyme